MLSHEHLKILLQPFGLSADEVQFVRYSQNYVYSGQYSGKQCIIRISTGRHRTFAQIKAELSWLTYLATKDIRACQPLPATDRETVHSINLAGENYLVTCFEHAPGNKISPADLTSALYEKLGRLLGQMHMGSAARTHQPTQRPHWHESRLLREDFIEKQTCLTESFLASVDELIVDLCHLPATSQNYGLLHGDVSFGNCFLHEDDLWIFDFDNCEQGYFLQEFATVLYDSIYCKVLNKFADPGLTGRMIPLWTTFLSGYSQTGPQLAIEPALLKKFFLLREAIIYVHYRRILDLRSVNESFKAGLEVMRQNVENHEHQVDFSRF